MKIHKFVDGLHYKLAPLIYMAEPQDLPEAIDYATRVYTGHEIYNRKTKKVRLP